MSWASQERFSWTTAPRIFPEVPSTPSTPLSLGISERKQNYGAVPQVMQCGHSGKYHWPTGQYPHRKGDPGVALLIPDKQPLILQRGSSHAQKPHGQVLVETGTHRQELEWPLESWLSGSERASCRVEKGPRFSPQGPREVPDEFMNERRGVCICCKTTCKGKADMRYAMPRSWGTYV